MSTVLNDPPLTAQQQAVLEARDISVSLAAGAGCGKTFALTARFLAEVDPTKDGSAELDELVAITFTDAAAREMRDRIRKRCFERMQAEVASGQAEEARRWQRLMRSIDAARISTIHSFCTELLREHAIEAGLDPQFDVLDAAAAQLLKLQVVDDRLRRLLLAQNADALDLAAKRGLDRLRNDIAALAGPRGDDAIERWMDSTPEELVERWREFFETRVAPAALKEIVTSEAASTLRRLTGGSLAKTDKLRAHLAVFADHFKKCDEASSSEQVAALVEQLRGLARVQGVCTQKDWHDPENFAAFRDASKELRDAIDKSCFKKPFDPAAAREAAEQGLALLRLVADVNLSLDDVKARRNQLEFDDLLARAYRLLTDPRNAAVRKRLAEKTRLLLVDEFQDTNPLQVHIIQAFCGERWQERGLFAVGDFKQSIYRFTGAEPAVSTDLRNALPPAGRLSLTRNFRSQPAITDFVNAVFQEAFADYEPLAADRPQLTPMPAVEFLWTPCEEEGCDGPADDESGAPAVKKRRRGAAHDARALEAKWIARRLVQLLNSEERIIVEELNGKPTPRPLKPGDIAILLRTLSDAQVYEEALRAHGLEYYLAGGHAFYSQQEIYDVLNLLRTVASSVDEIALAGALRSPLFSLADETLFWLVQSAGSLNAALDAARPPEVLSALEAAKVRRAAETLSRLRVEKDRLLVADLLSLALELTGYDAVLLTEFLGERKAANIDKLIAQARTLDRTSPGDLQGFITQLSEFVLRAPKEALAATQAEGDVIRIMTIHYAKGLEFPLVVLPDLDRQRNLGSSQPVLDEELGPLVPVETEDKQACAGMDLYRQVENLEDLEERKRLFYVACTRAADYLLLSSSMEDPSKPKRDWLQLVNRTIDLADGSLRRPLPAGYDAPQVRVTSSIPRIDDETVSVARGADLERLVAKTRELAQQGAGELPRGADPIVVDGRARKRFSFSRLSGKILPEVSGASGALFESDERPRGMAFGSLVHAVLERVDFQKPAKVQEVCEFLAPQFVVGEWARAAEDAAKLVEEFLKSMRGQELAKAACVRREVEFLLPWISSGGDDAGRYFHGYLDCLYQDATGAWRLLDYKTNHATVDGVQTPASEFALQMLVYSLACEEALGQPLADCAIVFLQTGEEHAFDWDEKSRERGIERISAGMESLMAGEPVLQ